MRKVARKVRKFRSREKSKDGVVVVVRSFQRGTGGKGKPFDHFEFLKHARPVEQTLKYEIIAGVIVVTCGEPGNRLAENYIGKDETPTTQAFKEFFPDEVENGKLIIHIAKKWGQNVGSGQALNQGASIARKKFKTKYIMHWSPEFEINQYAIRDAMQFAELHRLSVVGFLKEGWWERPQWKIAQNTCSIWNLEALRNVGGFPRESDGTGRTIFIEGRGEILIGGMEDFYNQLRMMKSDKNFRIGMIGTEAPFKWEVKAPRGSQREKDHLDKIARQYIVMQEWAKAIFPNLPFRTVMNRFFKLYKQL